MAVFVLDDFDVFAAKARQTVLYNLLDCMQAPDIQARRLWSCGGSISLCRGSPSPHAA